MMRPGSLTLALFFGAVFTTLSALLVSCAAPTPISVVLTPADGASASRVVPGQAAARPNEPPAASPEPAQEVLRVLETYCARCHNTAWFEELDEKPRSGWEEALARMETLGVRLSDTEKVALLDYLVAAGKP